MSQYEFQFFFVNLMIFKIKKINYSFSYLFFTYVQNFKPIKTHNDMCI